MLVTSSDIPIVEAKIHDWYIAPREYARHEARRGRQHAYGQLDPTKTGLIVVDMVPFFALENSYVRGIVPNINALASALRGMGGMVVWVLPKVSAQPSAWALEFYGPQVAASFNASGGQGASAERLWPELDVQEGDQFVEKSAASAFFPGCCELPELLDARGIENVLITGTVSNVCCESSARDAATLGYRVLMVADANAAGSDAVHNAALHTIYRSFGDVRPTAEVLDILKPTAVTSSPEL